VIDTIKKKDVINLNLSHDMGITVTFVDTSKMSSLNSLELFVAWPGLPGGHVKR